MYGVPRPHHSPKAFGCHSHDPSGPKGGMPAIFPNPGHLSSRHRRPAGLPTGSGPPGSRASWGNNNSRCEGLPPSKGSFNNYRLSGVVKVPGPQMNMEYPTHTGLLFIDLLPHLVSCFCEAGGLIQSKPEGLKIGGSEGGC